MSARIVVAEKISAKALRELWIANPALQPEAYPLLEEKLEQLFYRYVH